MAGRKKYSLNLQVDDRTDGMSDQALICRTFGHKWAVNAISKKRFMELIALGQSEFARYCENGCGSTWRQVWNVRTGEVVENIRTLPKGDYRMPTGTGRLKRTEARVASFARKHPSYA